MTEHTEDVLKALRDELAGVSPSPEFQSRVRQRIAGELDLLREQLAAVEPSPEFKVRVRQGIEIDAARDRSASWLSGWRWVVPAAAAAALIVAVVVSRRGDAPAPVTVTAQSDVPTPVAPPFVGPANPGTAEPRSLGTSEPRNRRLRQGSGRQAGTRSDPTLEVITNQPALLRAMWARANATVAVANTTPAPTANAGGDIVIEPVEVAPVVVKWLIEPPAVPGVFPFIRRATADSAERSAK